MNLQVFYASVENRGYHDSLKKDCPGIFLSYETDDVGWITLTQGFQRRLDYFSTTTKIRISTCIIYIFSAIIEKTHYI